MFARSYKVTSVSIPLTRGRCGPERVSHDSLPPLPHRLWGWRWPTLLDHSRPQGPSAIVSWSRGLETRVSGSSPDVRKFRTSGYACAEVTNITAHAHNGGLSLTAPLGRKSLLPEVPPESGFFGLFWKCRLHLTTQTNHGFDQKFVMFPFFIVGLMGQENVFTIF